MASRPGVTQHEKTAVAPPLTGPETKNLAPYLRYVLRPLSRRPGGAARPGPGRGKGELALGPQLSRLTPAPIKVLPVLLVLGR